ncbi:DEKNAAC100033 [Brettanomyces naardenensis]|uniref:DEKNAAC100033 n=1 Tax=Brettanomyces naardenensis TaxID=13370 RepID=A0A448YEV3_BRENA|nr:DEKNAAC100033 [Brettanomyces naardenensis]
MSMDAPLKAEKDFSETLDEQFPQIDSLSRDDYRTAVDKLLLLEKQTRQASDLASSKRIMVRLVDLLAEKKDWDLLNEQIVLLSKKHGQLKDSVRVMIQQVIEHLDEIEDLDTKIEAIETIRTVTENKIFVELERARVTKALSDILLNQKHDLDKACEVLCELQVETYSSMELEEKIQFIEEQMTLSNLKGDYQFSEILSRKILVRTLESYADLKLRYYELMIGIATHADDYINVVKYNLSIYQIPKIQGDKEVSLEYLRQAVYFAILAPYSPLQNDLIFRIKTDKNLNKLPLCKSLIRALTTQEIIDWKQFEKQFSSELFKDSVYDQSTDAGKKHYGDLKKRTIEFNLRVISNYYSGMLLSRLCELLQLDQSSLEDTIIELVNSGVIYARINRPAKVVSFIKPKSENELLNEWSTNIDILLEDIKTIEHLIGKEEMLHGGRA